MQNYYNNAGMMGGMGGMPGMPGGMGGMGMQPGMMGGMQPGMMGQGMMNQNVMGQVNPMNPAAGFGQAYKNLVSVGHVTQMQFSDLGIRAMTISCQRWATPRTHRGEHGTW